MTDDFEGQVRRRLQDRGLAGEAGLARLAASIDHLPARRRRRLAGRRSAGSVAAVGIAFAVVVGIALIATLSGGRTTASPSPSLSPTPPPSPSTSVAPSPSASSSAPTVTPGPAASPPGGGLQTFDEDGITFAYPAGWRDYQVFSDTSMSSEFAELATANIPNPCATSPQPSPVGSVCPDTNPMPPGSMVVDFSDSGVLGFAPGMSRPPRSTALTVDGLPAYFWTPPSPSADQTVAWAISRPGSLDNYYEIEARLQGPGINQLRQQLDALIASLRYDPAVTPLPTGPDAALAAEQSALAALTKESPVWGCFSVSGPQSMVINSMPNGPVLARPQLATCTAKIEPSPSQMWRMTLTIRLAKPDPTVGSGEVAIQWIEPDGSLETQESGFFP
jgi:hypothetical protein